MAEEKLLIPAASLSSERAMKTEAKPAGTTSSISAAAASAPARAREPSENGISKSDAKDLDAIM